MGRAPASLLKKGKTVRLIFTNKLLSSFPSLCLFGVASCVTNFFSSFNKWEELLPPRLKSYSDDLQLNLVLFFH